MAQVLIDSSVLIGVTRKQPQAIEALGRLKGEDPVLCDVVLAEVLAGARNEADFDRLYAYLTGTYKVLSFTMTVSMRFREVMLTVGKKRGIHLSDQLIAAIALAHDCPLLTLNKKHFAGIEGLRLV